MSSTAWVVYNDPSPFTLTGADIGYAFAFLFLMIYLFIGIAFASDIFMNAIEVICGARRIVKVVSEEDGVRITNAKSIPVWNDTVANLTLMALGSSAPEILLSVIETCEGLSRQNPGNLGPGTIVGSAAYNLLIISGVCITCLKGGQTSRIKLYKVFAVTTLTSLFAYIWMVVVLEWNTKDQVDIWEALATLVMFPILVVVSYWADRDFCIKGEDSNRLSTISSQPFSDDDRHFVFDESEHLYDSDGNLNKLALQRMYTRLNAIAELTPEEVTTILATKLIQQKQHSKMWYRTQMTRTLMGGAKLMPVLNERLKEVCDAVTEETHTEAGRQSAVARKSQITPAPSASRTSLIMKTKAIVEFQAASLAVSEAIGKFNVLIYRTGKEDTGFSINVESYDGTAKKDKEYEPVKETVTFDPYVKEANVEVKIHDNVQWNPDLNFFLKLSVPPEFEDKAHAGQTRVIDIIIQDNDKPGRLSFVKRGYVFKPTKKVCYVEVERNGGSDGNVAVHWRIVPGDNCKLVKETTGRLEFKHQELKKYIEINVILPNADYDVRGKNEEFDVVLSQPEGGARLGKTPKTTCAISGDSSFKLEINDVITAALQLSEEAEEEVTYGQQICQSFKVNGGDYANATCLDYFLHILTFPYKVIFSFIPPPHCCGGWPTFILALASVGFLTKIVGETATAFGEAITLNPVITAITFVALGTSLPDTFASRISAMNDKTADNAVGNVTGSNSVNVFLGLGIPWTIGSLFYRFKHNVDGQIEPYCVPAGSLTFNVVVYTICAAIAVGVLTFRRYSAACGKAELGGPSGWKWITAIIMFSLWIAYIAMSSVQVVLLTKGSRDISLAFQKPPEGPCQRLIASYKLTGGPPPGYVGL